MQTRIFRFLTGALLVTAVAAGFPGTALDAPDPGWPRVLRKDGKQLTVHQPQVDYWKDYKDLRVRCAIAVSGVTNNPAEQTTQNAIEPPYPCHYSYGCGAVYHYGTAGIPSSGASPESGGWSQQGQGLEAQAQSRAWGNRQSQGAQSWRSSGGGTGGSGLGERLGGSRGGGRRR